MRRRVLQVIGGRVGAAWGRKSSSASRPGGQGGQTGTACNDMGWLSPQEIGP
jgi:hypothetical protein